VAFVDAFYRISAVELGQHDSGTKPPLLDADSGDLELDPHDS
jgi:hypothetical protein